MMDNPITIFTDKSNRQITIGLDIENIVAEHNGIEIGRFTFDEQDSIFLAIMEIDNKFQRNGIGVKMIEMAEEYFDDFNIVDHLSIEGESFLNYCSAQNIFKYKHKMIKDDRY